MISKKFPLLVLVSAMILSISAVSSGEHHVFADGTRLPSGRVAGSDIKQLVPDATGVAIASDGTIFIADRAGNRIVKIGPVAAEWTLLTSPLGPGNGLNQVREPTSLTIDANDNLYISDAGNHRVLKWAFSATAGTVVAGNGTEGIGLAQLAYPVQTAIGSNGELYVADAGNHRIVRFNTLTAGATAIIVAGNGTDGIGGTDTLKLNQLSAPQGIAVGSEVNPDIIVADTHNHRIIKFQQGTSSGVVLAGDGTSGSGQTRLDYPTSISKDGQGGFYITDQENNRVVRYEIGGSSLTSVAGDSSFSFGDTSVRAPRSIAVTGSLIYIAESDRVSRWDTVPGGARYVITGHQSTPIWDPFSRAATDIHLGLDGGAYVLDGNRVVIVDPGSGIGNLLMSANGDGPNLDQLSNPQDLEIQTNEGNIFIADTGNNRVVKWTPGASQGILIAGDGTSGSGLGQLSAPTGIDLGPDGSLFVADNGNHRIVKWAFDPTTNQLESTGTVVVAGTAGPALNQFGTITDIQVSDDETVTIADSTNNRVVRWASGATTGVLVAGGNGPGNASNQTWSPTSIALDSEGGVYVTSSFTHLVSYWAPNTNFGINIFDATEIGHATGVDVDQFGRAFALDTHYLGIVAQLLDTELSFGPLQDQRLGSGTVTMNLSSRAGAYPQTSSTTPTVCTIARTVVTLLSTGTCTIRAEVSGTMWTNTTASRSFMVAPAIATTIPSVATTNVPAVPNLGVKCSASGTSIRCVITKPSKVAKKSKVSYKVTCTSSDKKKISTVSSASKTVVLKVRPGVGTWTCSNTAVAGKLKWAKLLKVKVK